MTELTTAADITVESLTTAHGQTRTDEVSVNRWRKAGDRLYISGGIPKADKYNLYVDLETHTIHSSNDAALPGGDVTVDGETATVVIEDATGLETREHELVLDVEWDGDEPAASVAVAGVTLTEGDEIEVTADRDGDRVTFPLTVTDIEGDAAAVAYDGDDYGHIRELVSETVIKAPWGDSYTILNIE